MSELALKFGVVAMGNGLVGELETRLLRGKSALDYEDIEQYSGNAEAVKHTAGQTKLEFFRRRKYRLPQRPDVEIERKVWTLRGGAKRLAIV